MASIELYDTTLRDGSQQEGLTLSVEDKLAVARLLDALGVAYIEGGWPGAVPKDTEFFRRAAAELELETARLAAFGSTRRVGVPVAEDPQVQALLDSGAGTITLVAKSDSRHVEHALHTTPDENLAMVRDTVTHLAAAGRRVFVDAEHFFDGYRHDPVHAAAVVREAGLAGAERVVLCDTNGGMLPHEAGAIVLDLKQRLQDECPVLGIHTHNDSGCAVANALEAVRAGAVQVQACVNGYGERTGNADLVTVLADLQVKLGYDVVEPDRLENATRIAQTIGYVTNVPTDARSPYAGASAFAHKAGLHASAIRVDPSLYQHIDPRLVGNDMRMIVSDMAGRASIELKGRELGIDLSQRPEVLESITATVKQREAEGYSYEAADASFELLLLEQLGDRPRFFTAESWRIDSQQLVDGSLESEAVVKLRADGERRVAMAEGNGPVNALDLALRKALIPVYPELEEFWLEDFKVRILDEDRGTDATTRVLIETSGHGLTFSTVGFGANIVDASWEAITDAYTYGLSQVRGAA